MTGGTVLLEVKVQNIPIWRETDDLCTRTTCPVNEGELIVYAKVT